jgi:hypothetical protein
VRAAVVSFPRERFPPGDVTRLDEGRIADAERPHVRAQLARLQVDRERARLQRVPSALVSGG